MFVSVDGTYTWKHNEAVTTRGAVPFAIAQIVDRDNGGAWRAPSRAELAPLFAAQVESGETTTTYLNRVFKTEGRFAGQSFIWTSDTTKQQILYNYTCYTGCFGSYLDVTTYTGWDITGSRAEHKRQPAMPGGDRAWKDVRIAQQQRDAKWAETKGGVIATRNTGNRIYM